MANHSLRSAVVLALLLGTFALAIPSVTRLVDGWLFSEWDDEKSKWSSQRSAAEKAAPAPVSTQQAPSLQRAAGDLSPLKVPPASDSPVAPLAFEFQEEAADRPGGQVQPAVMRTAHVEEMASSPNALPSLQREFQDLGADYVVVEAVEGTGAFECRCLMPLAPQSSYQKAFSAVGSRPEAAMEQVLAEVRAWKRAGAGERLYRN